ncbi:hypothetical protein [Nannocystis punicea]|uniref:Uncharacterized protein n=1 Tax=Nannocystis punicea TaxID=2995304 RepID=A0ABY7GVA1_9BACT|nr:hypothetical protein [Nannocystis poenicansa]WAS90900.1 hypothetical protein O0S08_32325 [Nannocystis poenicansa]
MSRPLCLLSLLALASACVAPWPPLELCPESGCSSGEPGTSSSGSSDSPVPTGDVQTVTGASATTDDDPGPTPTTLTTGEPDDAPPVIELFEFEPSMLSEAGPSIATLKVRGNVTNVQISREGQIVASGPPDSLEYTFEVTSAKFNKEPHTFTARAFDGKGGVAEATAEVEVKLPASGAVRCTFQDTLVATQSGINNLVFDDGDVVAIGFRDSGGGPRTTLWRFDPKSCAPRPGWPRTVQEWSASQVVKNAASAGVAVALDENGYLAIAGNLIEGGKTRPYVALLTPEGSLIWETTGELGDQAAGVAKVRWPHERIVMVGSRLTNANPPRYDGLVIGFHEQTSPWVDVLKAPFTANEAHKDIPNDRSEKVLAVLADPDTAEVFVVGEREFRPAENAPDTFQRTFVIRLYPDGGRISTWTSSGDFLPHDSARSLKRCGSALLAGGWTRDKPVGSKPQPLVRWIDAAGTSAGRRSEPLADTQTFGIDCDREGKVVSAGARTLGNQTDVALYAFLDLDEPLVWQAQHDGLDMADDGAAGLACDRWGFCAWGGFETVNGTVRAILRVHAP